MQQSAGSWRKILQVQAAVAWITKRTGPWSSRAERLDQGDARQVVLVRQPGVPLAGGRCCSACGLDARRLRGRSRTKCRARTRRLTPSSRERASLNGLVTVRGATSAIASSDRAFPRPALGPPTYLWMRIPRNRRWTQDGPQAAVSVAPALSDNGARSTAAASARQRCVWHRRGHGNGAQARPLGVGTERRACGTVVADGNGCSRHPPAHTDSRTDTNTHVTWRTSSPSMWKPTSTMGRSVDSCTNRQSLEHDDDERRPQRQRRQPEHGGEEQAEAQPQEQEHGVGVQLADLERVEAVSDGVLVAGVRAGAGHHGTEVEHDRRRREHQPRQDNDRARATRTEGRTADAGTAPTGR